MIVTRNGKPKQLGFVSNGGYEELSRGADEVGRMLGGWLKYEKDETGQARDPLADRPTGGGGARKRSGGVRYTMRSPTVERYSWCDAQHPCPSRTGPVQLRG